MENYGRHAEENSFQFSHLIRFSEVRKLTILNMMTFEKFCFCLWENWASFKIFEVYYTIRETSGKCSTSLVSWKIPGLLGLETVILLLSFLRSCLTKRSLAHVVICVCCSLENDYDSSIAWKYQFGLHSANRVCQDTQSLFHRWVVFSNF